MGTIGLNLANQHSHKRFSACRRCEAPKKRSSRSLWCRRCRWTMRRQRSLKRGIARSIWTRRLQARLNQASHHKARQPTEKVRNVSRMAVRSDVRKPLTFRAATNNG